MYLKSIAISSAITVTLDFIFSKLSGAAAEAGPDTVELYMTSARNRQINTQNRVNN